MYDWGWIWTPPVARQKLGEDAIREVPCGFKRHLLSPLSQPPHLSSRLLVRQPGSLPANGKHAAAQRDLVRVRPRGSSSLCDACTDPQSRGSAGSLGHRGGGGGGGGVAASAPEASRLHSNTCTHICIFFFFVVDGLFFSCRFCTAIPRERVRKTPLTLGPKTGS